MTTQAQNLDGWSSNRPLLMGKEFFYARIVYKITQIVMILSRELSFGLQERDKEADVGLQEPLSECSVEFGLSIFQ